MKLNGMTDRANWTSAASCSTSSMSLRQTARDAAGWTCYYQRAFDVLTSSKLVEALDVTKEPATVRDRYGRGSPKHLGDGAPQWNDQLLMARRLVEAGARCVTVAYGFWDTHGGNFQHLKNQLPLFDQGISALVEDIYARGLDQDVTVVVWGEFGRTPKINKDAGRDHWARVNPRLLAGGGMTTGQVIGSTDSTAAEAKDQPIHYHDVLATVYQQPRHRPAHDGQGRGRPAQRDPAGDGATHRETSLRLSKPVPWGPVRTARRRAWIRPSFHARG